MNPLVSIIIPHWNHRGVLTECLDSLSKTEYDPFEIIMVDNNSADDSVKYVRENYPEVNIVVNEKNLGFAGGCNV